MNDATSSTLMDFIHVSQTSSLNFFPRYNSICCGFFPGDHSKIYNLNEEHTLTISGNVFFFNSANPFMQTNNKPVL